jgi:2-iminobutanoate/2-iminopropanoate deaminase
MARREIVHTGTRLDLDRVANEVTGTTFPIAPAARVGDVVYTAGLVGIDPDTGQLVEGGFEPQAERVLENLRLVLEAAGTSLDNVAKVTVFLADIEADFPAFNVIYRRYFGQDFPARAAVQARLAFDALRVEVEAIAAV